MVGTDLQMSMWGYFGKTCPGVVAATRQWSVGCEGDNHLCRVWKTLSYFFPVIRKQSHSIIVHPS